MLNGSGSESDLDSTNELWERDISTGPFEQRNWKAWRQRETSKGSKRERRWKTGVWDAWDLGFAKSRREIGETTPFLFLELQLPPLPLRSEKKEEKDKSRFNTPTGIEKFELRFRHFDMVTPREPS